MSLSNAAFTYRRLMFAVFAGLMFNGLISYFQMPSREDPKITIREAVVTTENPGMPAHRIEQLITKTLEEVIIEMPEIEEIRSVSQPGVSIIRVEVMDKYFNLDQIWDDLRHQLDKVVDQLPDGTYTPQVNDNFGDVAVVTAALTGTEFGMGELFDMAQHLRTQLYTVKGTEKVEILGVQDERIYIEYANTVLDGQGISPEDLAQQIRAQNIIQAGGEVTTAQQNLLIELTGTYLTQEQIGDTLIALPGGGHVALRELVTVRRGTVDPPMYKAFFNGKPALVLAVGMRDGENVLEYAPRVLAQLDMDQALLPAGMQLEVINYAANEVNAAVGGVTRSVLQTLVIVLATVILFLGWRTGLIVGAIVPTVMLITLSVMAFSGINLERMSLATLIISLGLLVDNGIVIAEDFLRGLENGETREHALFRTGRELAIPLLTSSLTTVLVFMPLMLAEHVAGEYTRSISLVILFSLTISWLIALTLTPTLCYLFIKVPEKGAKPKKDLNHRLFDAMAGVYGRSLRWALRHRVIFMLLMAGLLGLTVVAMGYVRQEFFPGSDRTQLMVYMDMPAGSPSAYTEARMAEVFAYLDGNDELPALKNFAGYQGFSGPRFVLSLDPIDPAPNKAMLVLNIDHKDNLDATKAKLEVDLLHRFPDINFRVSRMFLGPSDSSVIQIQVKGPDADFLYSQAEEVMTILRNVPDTIHVRNDWEGLVPRMRVDVDQLRARRAGVTSEDIAAGLNTYFSGRDISNFREGDEIFPIVLRAKQDERTDTDRLKDLTIYPRSGGPGVPLMSVADIGMVDEYARYARENLVRTITIEAINPTMSAEALAVIVDDQLNALAQTLPPNYVLEYDGVVAMSVEAQAALRMYLPVCLGLIFLVLMAQFNSFKRTGLVLITLPLLIIGAILGLLVTNAPLGFMVTLGLYSLAGILANNAIVLIDRIDLELASANEPPVETVVKASVRRLRPIVMSTGTTILGLLPLIIARDVLFHGMASAIAGGLLVGTLLTLGLVPVLYTWFFRINTKEMTA